MMPERPVEIGSPEWHQNLSRYMMTVQDLVDKHGWAIQGVGAGETTPSFCHTVGLHNRGLPDLMIVGVPFEAATEILNQVAHASVNRGGVPDTWNLANGYKARIVGGRSCDTRNLKAGFAHQYYRGHVPMAQIIWPNEDGVYPGEPGWVHGDEVQPLLDAWVRG